MKKFFIILCILALVPIYAFATSSPTIEKTINCNPAIDFRLGEETRQWPIIVEYLKEFEDDTMIDAVYIFVKRLYKKVEWQLSVPITEKQNPYVIIINNNRKIIRQDLEVNEKGNIIMNMNDFGIGFFNLCFYIKGT